MSGEQLTAKELNTTSINRKSGKVDINDLLSKVRHEKNKENMYFSCNTRHWANS